MVKITRLWRDYLPKIVPTYSLRGRRVRFVRLAVRYCGRLWAWHD